MSVWHGCFMLPELLGEFTAALVHGEPRLTKDVDLTVGVGLDGLYDLIGIVDSVGWSPLADPDEFTRKTMVLPCRVPGSPLRVDLILADSPYEAEALIRARELGATRDDGIRYATAEDVIVHKLIAGRPRDLEDARSILLKQSSLDRAWIRRWLAAYATLSGEPLVDRFERLESGD